MRVMGKSIESPGAHPQSRDEAIPGVPFLYPLKFAAEIIPFPTVSALYQWLFYHKEDFPPRYMPGRMHQIRVLTADEIRRIREMRLIEGEDSHYQRESFQLAARRPKARGPLAAIMRRAMASILLSFILASSGNAQELVKEPNDGETIGWLLNYENRDYRIIWPPTAVMRFNLEVKDEKNVDERWTSTFKPGAVLPLCLYVVDRWTIVANPCPVNKDVEKVLQDRIWFPGMIR